MTWKKGLLIVIAIIVVTLIGGYIFLADNFEGGTSKALQHDFDIARLNDLATLSAHIEKYKEETGKYPFQGETELPHYIHINTKEQEPYASAGPPFSHKRTSAKAFASELISKLGSDIQIPFDLQRVPVNKPNFYIYLITDETYYLAVHLHNDFPFVNKLGDYYSKLEVTNNPGPNRNGTWLRSDLMEHVPYNKARSASPNKPGYVEQLRVKLGGNNAF